MRLWIRAHRRKISERLCVGSGHFPDAVPKSSGRWRRKKARRNPAAGAGAARSVLLSRWVEDQNPQSELSPASLRPDWRLLSINLKLTVINPERFRAALPHKDSGERGLYSSGERRLPACTHRHLADEIVFGKLPTLPNLPTSFSIARRRAAARRTGLPGC